MKNHLKIIFKLGILCVVLLPINYYVLEELFNIEFTGLYYFSFAYYFIMVFAVHLVMSKALKNRPQNYIVAFMASMGIKMFLSLIILVIILYAEIESSKIFGVNYLLLYMIFSAFSIMEMLKAQKTFQETK